MNIIMEVIYYLMIFQYLLIQEQNYILLNLMEQKMKMENMKEEIFFQTILMFPILVLIMKTNLKNMILLMLLQERKQS